MRGLNDCDIGFPKRKKFLGVAPVAVGVMVKGLWFRFIGRWLVGILVEAFSGTKYCNTL